MAARPLLTNECGAAEATRRPRPIRKRKQPTATRRRKTASNSRVDKRARRGSCLELPRLSQNGRGYGGSWTLNQLAVRVVQEAKTPILIGFMALDPHRQPSISDGGEGVRVPFPFGGILSVSRLTVRVPFLVGGILTVSRLARGHEGGQRG